MKRVIYGAGEIGKKAYEFYGEDQVVCFVDQYKCKSGELFCNKPVISLDKYVAEYLGYQLVVASRNCRDEMVKALEEKGVTSFSVFEDTRKQKIFDYFEKHSLSKYKKIGIFGTGKDASLVLGVLKQIFPRNIYVFDRNANQDFEGHTVMDISKANGLIDAIVIASEKFHVSIETRLEMMVSPQIEILSPFKLDTYYSPNKLVFNKYVDGDEFLSEEEIINSKKTQKYAFDRIASLIEEVSFECPKIKAIEIETYNKCNGVCQFCPVNINNDTREHHFMDSALFFKIIDELSAMNYSGRISLFSNNEPLLDARIYEFSRYMRRSLPMAKIHMFTNGTLFTLDKFMELIPELDELIIDNYTQNMKLIKPVEEIRQYCEEHQELIEKVSIVIRKPNEILTTRGGEAPNRKVKVSYDGVACTFPFQQMVIRPTGEVSLCCNDPLGKNTLGDVSKQSIIEVWQGEPYQKVRKIIASGREKFEYCKYCDVFSCYL